MVTKRRYIVLPVETDSLFSVRGMINEGRVRVVQIDRNDFFIPPNLLKKAFFALEGNSMKVGDRQDGKIVSFQRIENADKGEMRIRFMLYRTNVRDIIIPFSVMEEIVERIDQAKALLHSYSPI